MEESLAHNHTIHLWLLHYGNFALFILLALGILALPVPEETMMVFAGILMHQGDLSIPSTIVAAILGSLSGITASYILGRTAGNFLIERYGGWLGIGPTQMNKAHAWFEHYGKWTLFFGYFIPGVRHFTGFTAGTTSLDYREFALFAYSGALIWVATFLSFGYFLGSYWFTIFKDTEVDADDILSVIILIGFIYLIYYLKIKKSNS